MTYVLAKLVCGDEMNVTMQDVQVASTFCHSCHTKRGIVDIIVQEWYSYCYDCKHRRYWGDDQEMAKDAARRHWRRFNNHRAFSARGTRPKSLEARDFLIKRGIVTSCG